MDKITERISLLEAELNELKQHLIEKEQEETAIEFKDDTWYYSPERDTMIYVKDATPEAEKMIIRYPGDPAEILVYSEEYQDVIEMDLVPDFTGKDGEQAFSVRLGMTEIENTQASENDHSVLEIENHDDKFTIEGRYIRHYNPEVFHNIAQCVAYFQELHLKEISEDQN